MIYKNVKEMEKACVKWQKVMKLQDWEVICKIQRGRNMPIENTQGCCEWHVENKQAVISLIDPTDYNEHFEQDMEETLVHELIHLHTAPFDTFKLGTMENTALEQMINSLARAMVTLKRS